MDTAGRRFSLPGLQPEGERLHRSGPGAWPYAAPAGSARIQDPYAGNQGGSLPCRAAGLLSEARHNSPRCDVMCSEGATPNKPRQESTMTTATAARLSDAAAYLASNRLAADIADGTEASLAVLKENRDRLTPDQASKLATAERLLAEAGECLQSLGASLTPACR